MIRNFVFDLGNVLFRFSGEELTRIALPEESEETRRRICDVVFSRRLWDPLDSGEADDEEAVALIREELPKELWEKAERAYFGWIGNMPRIQGMEELLLEIKRRGGKLYLISNICKGFARHYEEFPEIVRILSHFDGLVLSGPLRMVKPDPEIFHYLLNTYGLDPSECVFIDDAPRNAKGAEQVGIKGIVFDGDVQKLTATLLD